MQRVGRGGNGVAGRLGGLADDKDLGTHSFCRLLACRVCAGAHGQDNAVEAAEGAGRSVGQRIIHAVGEECSDSGAGMQVHIVLPEGFKHIPAALRRHVCGNHVLHFDNSHLVAPLSQELRRFAANHAAGLFTDVLDIAVVPYMDLLLRLDVQILQIARPSWEREFYLIHDSRAYQSPAAHSFRVFILDGVAL